MAEPPFPFASASPHREGTPLERQGFEFYLIVRSASLGPPEGLAVGILLSKLLALISHRLKSCVRQTA